MSEAKPEITLFFPVFNDENTVRQVTEKALEVLSELASESEVLIIDDGSPDRSGEIADELADPARADRIGRLRCVARRRPCRAARRRRV